MKKINKFLGSLAACAAMLGGVSTQAVAADINIIPVPVKTQVQKGEFVLPQKVVISYQTADGKNIAEYMADKLKASTGYDVTVGGKKGNISIQISPSMKMAEEGYRLTVTSKGVVIKAKTGKGAFYGMQSFMQLLPAQVESATKVSGVKWVAQCCDIQDAPRFGYRGFHLDPCRHFITVENVKKQLDIMSMFKVNTMHFHLTEDQGWRIEIKKYPELTSIGGYRLQGDGSTYGGFYTQEEIKDIVDYAAKRYITVIPEIDLPGHMMAAIAAYPSLSCKGEQWTPRMVWGVEDIVMCPGKEDMFRFLEDIVREVVPLFPGKYFHIGGDECPKTSWKNCPACQKRIEAEGLQADGKHSAEERLQSYVIKRMEKMLAKYGRKIIGWDEILEGGLAPNATVMSWRGEKGGIEAAKQKHDVIMTPNTYLYFDYYQTKDTENEPLGIGGYLPLERVYSYEPMPASLTPEEQKYIKGVQANLWTEYIPTFSHAQYMVLPRWAALSEIQWSAPDKKNYEDFLSRLPRLIKWYDAEGYNYAKHVFNVTAEYTPNPTDGTLDITLSTIDNAPIHYTLDGTEPTAASPLYESPLKIKENVTFSAIAVRPTGNSRVVSEKVNFSKSSMKPIVANQPVNKQYMFKGESTLVDGLKGNGNYKTGRWIAFYKNDMDMTIDLQQPTEISSVAISTCVEKGDWVFDARGLSVEVSDDGKNFTKVASEEYPAMKESDKNGIYEHKLSFSPVKTQYVKVVALSESKMPAWHGGKDSPAFLFVDEITID